MGSKKKRRPQPAIEIKRQKQDDYKKCRTPECKNVIATWARSDYCISCKARR